MSCAPAECGRSLTDNPAIPVKGNPSDLGEFGAFGTVATIRQIAGHGGVATGGTEEPFSVGSRPHEFEIALLDTIGAADGTVVIALDSSHFDDEGVTFFVHREATVVDGGSLGSERLGTDRAASGFGVHHYRYRFAARGGPGK